jgi:glycosyltransferase involved in cell wall biosynthesis
MSLILLATFNGAAWLPAFLASVQSQTRRDWRMLVRDDDSKDHTLQILEAAASDSRITVLDDGGGRLGVTRNFGRLMEHARQFTERYIFFADQDDVWLPQKLERQTAAIAAMESALGEDVPLLVHSDLELVDRDLRQIHPSHTAFARVRRACPADRLLATALLHNFATGCASAINRPLLDVAAPLPTTAVLHDWWVTACAAALGQIGYLPEPLVRYRQHSTNAVGAAGSWRRWGPRILLRKTSWQRIRANLERSFEQARALRDLLRESPTATEMNRRLVDYYCHCVAPGQPRWRRLAGLVSLRQISPIDRALVAAWGVLAR